MSSIQVICGDKSFAVRFNAGETLLSALRRAGVSIPAACVGRGKCGKCRVSVNSVSRLACKVIPTDGDVITLPETSSGMILTDTIEISPAETNETGYAAAVDLGTTTVAVRLYELSSSRELGTVSSWNAQAAYGADVISRIQHTIDDPDGLKTLSDRIRKQVSELIALLMRGHELRELKTVVIAGNTVMQHIFAACEVKSIAVAPFKPETLFWEPVRDELLGAQIVYSPCVAGYVGGDITAGLLASGLYEKDGCFLFLDIGTNGEMAIGGRGGFTCCAVASGPAFEGAGISCGMAGIGGAISHVRYDNGFLYDVIGSETPRGLCGSGLIDLVAALIRLGVIDESGRLLPPCDVPEKMRRYVTADDNGNGVFHLTPEVYLTAADVRNLQLAKAAVAAGVQVLLNSRGKSAEELDGVYIAGGFGTYIDIGSAMDIGMLPRLGKSLLHCLGNTSLAGASMAALSSERRGTLLGIAEKCGYIELSGRQDFTQYFTDNMTF